MCVFQIYFSNTTHPDGYVKRKGHGDRPFVLSNGPSLFVKFEAGEDPYAIPYVGFKANYQFVTGWFSILVFIIRTPLSEAYLENPKGEGTCPFTVTTDCM